VAANQTARQRSCTPKPGDEGPRSAGPYGLRVGVVGSRPDAESA